jgi:pimeloyl-ACP methyl ester carboxylesterase
MELMAIRKSYVDCSAGQIHVAARSGEGLPIICFHQTASSGTSFYRLMAHEGLANPIYALDTPGFGGSFDPPDMPNFAQYGGWLFEAIQALGLDRFHTVGHHTGAGFCVELAAQHPACVASMTLIGPFPLTAEEREEFRPHFSTPISPTADGAYLQETWDYLRKLGAHGELDVHHEEVLNHVRAHFSRFQTYSSVWDYDFTTPYRNSTCPTLLMAAPDDVLYPYLARSKEMRPDAEVVELAGANFEPALDTDAVVSAMSAFLARP